MHERGVIEVQRGGQLDRKGTPRTTIAVIAREYDFLSIYELGMLLGVDSL